MVSPLISGQHPERPSFTSAQQVQALYIGRVTEKERRLRPTIVTHAIDNVTPDIIADRDDGIFVEVEHSGNKSYMVHVTIADVAAHVRPGSPLGDAAWQRAFTVYKPGSTDSMFPKILEQNLSLEHHQERLGLTVNIMLNAQFKPVHTSFTPVITMADNASYAEARTRISNEPQFGLMAKIAEGIKHGYGSMNNEAWSELINDRRTRRGDEGYDIKTMQMVATYMLLANNCVAEFFNAAQLPFLYRNFDDSHEGAHATYGTEALGHSAIESQGVKGAYCHFTSPIRRAPDYFNGVMVHYVVETLAQIEKQMKESYPELDACKLKNALWENGPEITKMVTTLDMPPKRNRAALRTLLYDIANQSLCDATSASTLSERPLIKIVNELKVVRLPYTTTQLDQYAAHMNALVHCPEMTQIARVNDKFDGSLEIMEAIKEKTQTEISALSPEKFSSVLQAAALTGEMPANLFDETMQRLTTKNFDKTKDGFSIFIQAQYPSSTYWRALKGKIAQLIKNDPATVNALLDKLGKHIYPSSIQEQYLRGPESEKENRIQLPAHIHSELLIMQTANGTKVAAPFYSVGHDMRAALSHARYSFLEHYAFGELQPIEHTAIPNLLYADLELQGTKKRELIERMVRDNGAQLNFETQPNSSGAIITRITVKGGDIMVPITEMAEGETREASVQSALRHMLRNDAFRIAMSRHQDIAEDLLNPQTVLEQELRKMGGSVTFTISPVNVKSDTGFIAVATICLQGETTSYTATEPNMHRAHRVAAALALESLGSLRSALPTPSHAGSWASLARSQPINGDRKLHP